MKSRTSILMFLLVFSLSGYADDAMTSLQVGETWTFEHKGPQPWSRDDGIYGDRTMSVLSKDGEFWVVKEMWGKYDESPTRAYVDTKGLAQKFMMGSDRAIEFKPGIPYRILGQLKVGESKKFEPKPMTMGEYSVQYEITLKREKDESVEVPAGAFPDANKYIFNGALKFTGTQGVVTFEILRTIWVHSKVNGIVKEEYEFHPLDLNGPPSVKKKSVSVLKKYAKEAQ